MSKKNWLLLAGLAFLIPVGQSYGFQEKADKSGPQQEEAKQELSPAKQIMKLIGESQKAQLDFRKEVTKAQKEKLSRAEMNKRLGKLFSELRANDAKLGPKILKIAKASPKAEGMSKALIASMRFDRSGQIAKLLMEHHSEGDNLMPIALQHASRPGFGAKRALKQILESKASEKVKSVAKYGLIAAKMNGFKGDEAAEKELVAEFKSAIDGLGKGGGAVAGIKRSAKSLLFEFQNLRIGKVAPEIDGIDIDGVDFKLSDYRGKVVFLDFWGDW